MDWEAWFHELGHAFLFIFTDPDLLIEEREFFISGGVSETFAFLFQRLSMKKQFTRIYLGLSRRDADTVDLDYFLAFLASGFIERWLIQKYGDIWFQDEAAWNILKK